MDIKYESVILHVLDTEISMPVLSSSVLDMTDDEYEYVDALIKKTYTDGDFKYCSFCEDSDLLTLLQKENFDIITVSKHIAESIFRVMRTNTTVPNADLLFAVVHIDSKRYFAVLKLNYRKSFIHHLPQNQHTRIVRIIKQRTALPALASILDEAFFIDTSSYEIRLVEKKYTIDGAKEFYLSNIILSCTQSITERAKLRLFREAAEESIKQNYDNGTVIDNNITALIAENINNGRLKTTDIKHAFEQAYPAAKEDLNKKLETNGFESDASIQVQPKIIRTINKRSFKTRSGVEIKMPIGIDEREFEFINNPDGTIYLLLKNIVV